MYLNYLVTLTLIIIDNFDNVYIIWGCNTLCPGDRRLILKKGPDNKHHSRHRCVVTLNKMHYSLCAVWNLCCQNSLQRRGRVGSPSIPTEFAK